MPGATVLAASNRGPLSFATGDDGTLRARRGGGGLVSGMSSIAHDGDALWVCAALSDADRRAVRESPGGRLDRAGHDTGAAVRMLDIEPTTFNRAYNGVANSTLWFVNHQMWDLATMPVFDRGFALEWQAYVDYNAAFADALAEEAAPGARVLIQDYHLTLAPRLLRDRRPDLRIGHFMHTPWAAPSYFSVLPDEMGREVLRGIAGADAIGFLSSRWAQAYLDCCRTLLDAEVAAGASALTLDGRRTHVDVHPLGVDAVELEGRAAQTDVASRRASLQERVGDRRAIVRVDRTELSKNIVRGLLAYRELLRTHPEWRGRVVHVVLAYPSRHDLPEYRAYTGRVQRIAHEIDLEFATPDWSPVLLEVNDDYARSLAAYQIAEVLVVNPIRDGMNLVAKEGPVLSQPGCALVLSREAGAYDELADDVFAINPYDVTATAAAMHEALLLPEAQRRARAERLAAKAVAFPPIRWFAAQLEALDRD